MCNLAAAAAAVTNDPTPVPLPGKSHGWRSPVGCGPWDAKSRTRLNNFTFTHWRRKWQPTPVFLPWESQGRVCPVGGRPWGRTESDSTEVTQQQQQLFINLPMYVFLPLNAVEEHFNNSCVWIAVHCKS